MGVLGGFARAFKVTYPDGTVHSGAQFPSGRCVLDAAPNGLIHAAAVFAHLRLPPDAEVEWADGGDQP